MLLSGRCIQDRRLFLFVPGDGAKVVLFFSLLSLGMAFLLPSHALNQKAFRSVIRCSSSTFGIAGFTLTSRTAFAIPSANRLGLTAQRSYLSTMARERVLIVGTGWAGYTFSRALDDKAFDVQIVSPETAFPYTPLLVRVLPQSRKKRR